jgi:hypothetical protein
MLFRMRLITVLGCLALAAAGASLARAAAALSPEKKVDRVVLRAAQVGPGSITREIPGGRDVKGQITLDLCGYRFRSEKLRVARVQLSWISNTGGPPFLSNEVVAYKPGGAAKAIKELRTAIATCPKGFVKSTVLGAGLIRNKFNRIRGHGFLPGTVGVIDHITEKTKGKTLRFDSLLVYQERGNVLSGVYSFGALRLPLVVNAATQSAKNLRKL